MFQIFVINKRMTDMNDKLKVEEIYSVFGDQPFTSDELYSFYQKYDSNLHMSTFRWRIHALKNLGAIIAIKRGVYAVKMKKDFEPTLSRKLKSLFSKVQHKFPYAALCLWETSWLHNLMVHQPFSSSIVLEIDKAAASALFAFLQESYKDVHLNPGKDVVSNYLTAGQYTIIIKNLLTTSPLKERQNVTIPTVEKIMVDLFVEKKLFSIYQGAELQNIYEELFRSYNINRSALMQYAHKRHVKERLITFLKEGTDIAENELLL